MKAIKSTLAQTGPALYIKSLIFGVVVGCGILALLMCITSLILLISGKLPHNILKWIVTALCSISAFVGGYVTARVTKANGLLWGALSGVIMFIILLMSGLIWGDGNFTYITLIKLLALTLFGGLGGIKGVNKKEKLHIK